MKNFYVQEISLLALHLDAECYKEKYRSLMRMLLREPTTFTPLYFLRMLYNKESALARSKRAKEVLLQCQNNNINVITIFDERYPSLLKEIKNPPLLFFAQGNVKLLQEPLVSMVGTRKPSPMGAFLAETTAHYFAQDAVVVSGMALGIDAVCHRTAIKKKGSIGVVAQGFFHRYPMENFDLYQRASEKNSSLLLISEYSPATSPRRFHFPRRNRLIAGLSPLTVFVEGGKKSGANITVEYALDQGRDVAVIHHPQMPNNEGGKKWLQEGALNLLNIMKIENGKQPHKSLLAKLQDENTTYLGNGKWLTASFLCSQKSFL